MASWIALGPLVRPSDTWEPGVDVGNGLSIAGSSVCSEDGEVYCDPGMYQMCRLQPGMWVYFLHAGKVGLGMIGCGGEVGVGIGVGIGAGLTDGHVEDEELGVTG
jgi:hypothetical protein